MLAQFLLLINKREGELKIDNGGEVNKISSNFSIAFYNQFCARYKKRILYQVQIACSVPGTNQKEMKSLTV
jgi:hypothetical protein